MNEQALHTDYQPKLMVRPDRDSASADAAEIVRQTILAAEDPVLGLATGGTPVVVYRELVRMHRDDGLDFSHVTTFNLDEYIGLGGDHPSSFRSFMQNQLFDHINIDPQRTHVPDGLATDATVHAAEYERRIERAGGIDLQILGIGHNGHIAFNEPGSAADSRTRVVSLTDDTIQKNARFFDSIDDVPSTALTMGIGTILESKRILLLAFGSGKAEAIKHAVVGEVTTDHPASLLRKHPDVTFLTDEAAASGLSND